MNVNLSPIKLILAILFILTFSVTVSAQSKFHYLSVEFSISYNDSINYSIDVSGLDSILKDKIKPYISKTIKIKTEIELFNALGKIGWELYLIQDTPNKITQIRNNYNGQLTGDYSIYSDGIYSKRKVFFKFEEK